MVEIVNTITNFLNKMTLIDFTNTTSTLPIQVQNLYTSYAPMFIKYFAIFILILGFYKFLKFVFSLGGYNK